MRIYGMNFPDSSSLLQLQFHPWWFLIHTFVEEIPSRCGLWFSFIIQLKDTDFFIHFLAEINSIQTNKYPTIMGWYNPTLLPSLISSFSYSYSSSCNPPARIFKLAISSKNPCFWAYIHLLLSCNFKNSSMGQPCANYLM